MLSRLRPLWAAPLALGVGFAAASLAAVPAAAQETHTIDMTEENTFNPATVTIGVGDTVEWQNASSVGHTATFDPGMAADAANVVLPEGVEPFDSGNVAAGESWSHTFEVAGTYQYVCLPHEAAGMIGEIVVEE